MIFKILSVLAFGMSMWACAGVYSHSRCLNTMLEIFNLHDEMEEIKIKRDAENDNNNRRTDKVDDIIAMMKGERE